MEALKRRFGSLETSFWEPLDGSGHLETMFRVLLFGNFWKTFVLRKSSFYLGKTTVFEDLGTSSAVKVGHGTTVSGTLGRQVGPETVVWEPGNVILEALKRCFGTLWTVQDTLKRCFGCFFSVIFGKRAFCENRRFT